MVGSAFGGAVLVNAGASKAKPYCRLNLGVIATPAMGAAFVSKVAV